MQDPCPVQGAEGKQIKKSQRQIDTRKYRHVQQAAAGKSQYQIEAWPRSSGKAFIQIGECIFKLYFCTMGRNVDRLYICVKDAQCIKVTEFM